MKNVISVVMKKAGNAATLVACGWAMAVLEVNRASGQEQYAQKAKKRQKSKKRDRPTNQPTDQPMDQHSGV